MDDNILYLLKIMRKIKIIFEKNWRRIYCYYCVEFVGKSSDSSLDLLSFRYLPLLCGLIIPNYLYDIIFSLNE